MQRERRKVSAVRYLFDTSALLAHFRQEAGWKQVQALLESDDSEVVVASVSMTEFGRRLIDLGVSPAEAEAVLTEYSLLLNYIVTIDVSAAMAAFRLGSQTPQRLLLIDALICGAAQVHAAVLVHRDAHMGAISVELLNQFNLTQHQSDEI